LPKKSLPSSTAVGRPKRGTHGLGEVGLEAGLEPLVGNDRGNARGIDAGAFSKAGEKRQILDVSLLRPVSADERADKGLGLAELCRAEREALGARRAERIVPMPLERQSEQGRLVHEILFVPAHEGRRALERRTAAGHLHELRQMHRAPGQRRAVTPRDVADAGRGEVAPGAVEIEPEVDRRRPRLGFGAAAEEPREVHDRALVAPGHDQPVGLPRLDLEIETASGHGQELGRYLERLADEGRRQMLDLDLGADARFARVVAILDREVTGLFEKQDERRRRHHLDAAVAGGRGGMLAGWRQPVPIAALCRRRAHADPSGELGGRACGRRRFGLPPAQPGTFMPRWTPGRLAMSSPQRCRFFCPAAFTSSSRPT